MTIPRRARLSGRNFGIPQLPDQEWRLPMWACALIWFGSSAALWTLIIRAVRHG